MDRPGVVLVSEDPTFCYVVSQWLEAAGRTVAVTRDERSLPLLLETKRPDALVIEVSVDTGFLIGRLVDAVRADPRTTCLPIIVCSADPEFHTRHAQYLELRGCQVLGKPLSPETLTGTITTLTRRVPLVAWHSTAASI